MIKVLVSGANGFLGSNLIKQFDKEFIIEKYNRANKEVNLDSINVFIHLAGKSDDTSNSTNYKDYFESNVELTKRLFNEFVHSNCKKFIFVSSIKACCDSSKVPISEESTCSPTSIYGKSKLMAEQYLNSKDLPKNKKLYILRPCLIHGPGNKGNLNLLFNLVSKGLPWPFGAFDNKRSYCSIDNFLFILKELIVREDIQSGIYNLADDESFSTNEIIKLIAETSGKKNTIWNIPTSFLIYISKLNNIFRLPLNTERLSKLTDSLVVNNRKIKESLKKELPISSRGGLMKTFQSFKNNGKGI